MRERGRVDMRGMVLALRRKGNAVIGCGDGRPTPEQRRTTSMHRRPRARLLCLALVVPLPALTACGDRGIDPIAPRAVPRADSEPTCTTPFREHQELERGAKGGDGATPAEAMQAYAAASDSELGSGGPQASNGGGFAEVGRTSDHVTFYLRASSGKRESYANVRRSKNGWIVSSLDVCIPK